LKVLLDEKDEKINYFPPVDQELITSFVGLIIRVLRSTEIKESNLLTIHQEMPQSMAISDLLPQNIAATKFYTIIFGGKASRSRDTRRHNEG
jgi:hypothetical protein